MEQAKSSPPPSAAYGRACANCVKAKCKCILREDSSACDRCHRLAKECQPADFVRKRGQKRKATRRSHLEDKLDDLVELLKAQRAGEGSLSVAQPTPAPQPPSGIAGMCGPPFTIPIPIPEAGSPRCLEIARQILPVFKSRYLALFPLMHIPADVSVETFVRERPLTARAISVICEKSRTRQIELGAATRQEVSRRVVAGGERNLDLLQTLLICMNWQIYFTPSRRGGMGMFINIAKHVIADMGLNRPVGMVLACPKEPSLIGRPKHEIRTDEECRMVVACFALSAMACVSIKTEPMKWSPQLNKACEQLSANTDIKGDAVLVALARMSRVAVDAYSIIQQIADDQVSAQQALPHIRVLRTMLDQVKSTLTQTQLQDSTVRCYIYSVTIQIHEVALYGITPSSPVQPTLEYQRIEYLTACLHACKDCLDNYLSIPAVGLNMVTILAFSNSCQVLYNLSVLDYPGWDRYAARTTADVMWYLEQNVSTLEQARAQLVQENSSEDNLFCVAAGKDGLTAVIRNWKECLERDVGAPKGPDLPGNLFEGIEDPWMNQADQWFANIFGTTQFQ